MQMGNGLAFRGLRLPRLGAMRRGADLALNFLSGALDPRIRFTRASTGTHFNAAGVLTTAATDAPRFDYDPVTLAPRGLLIEGARTNLLTYSSEFDNAAWTKNAATVTANAGVAPDGTTTADTIVVDTSTATHGFSRAVSADPTQVQSYSVFVKYTNNRWFRMAVISGANRCEAWFDLLNGLAGSVSNVGVATGSWSTIRSVGGGWYRVTISGVADTTNTGTISVLSRIAQADLDVAAYLGNGTSSVMVWGAQHELGAMRSSYIATTTAAVTRAADVAVVTGSNFSSWFNQPAGTFVVEASRLANGITGVVLWATTDSAGPPRHQITVSTINTIGYAMVNDAGVADVAGIGASVITIETPAKFAVGYSLNDFAASTNGGVVQADASGTPPTALGQLFIGRTGGGADYMFGHIRRFDYYRTRLSNAQLQGLTL